MKRNLYTKEEEDFVKENYIKLGRTACAHALDRSNSSIKSLARRLGIKCSKDQILKAQSRRKKNIYTVNEKLFISEISEETAYLLGFLWADGHLHIHRGNTENYNYRTKMQILKNDAIQISSLFDQTGKWGKHFRIDKKNGNESISFNCSNPILGEFLEKHDYKIKSFVSPHKILSIIPCQFHRNFLHGYLDGDGCIFANKESNGYCVKFTSTYEQNWEFLIKICDQINCSYSIQRRLRKKSKYSSFEIHGSRNCLIFCDFIYKEEFKFGLFRKFEKYLLIREKTKNLIKEKKYPWVNPDEKYLNILNKQLNFPS